MILSGATKRNIILFISAFLLLGVLHVSLYGVDFTISISIVLTAALVLLWAINAQKRIVDKRLRSFCLWLTASLLLHFVLQMIRYDLTENITAMRYIWYLMYVPMAAQPVFFFFLALNIRRPEGGPLPKVCGIVAAAGALLMLGVLTNDLHFQAWSFPDGVMIDNGQEKSGWLFVLVNIYIYGLYALALGIIFSKSHRYVRKKYRWIAAVPLLIGVTYFLLYPFELAKLFFPCHIWNMAEMSAFCIIATIEACIQLGMIPANSGYEELFTVISFPAVIADSVGNPVYQTEETVYPFRENGNTRIISHSIQGGTIQYPVDVEAIQNLNRELSERVEQLELRNAYLAQEARVKQESTELQTRNRLYEQISEIVKPQLERIDAVLSESAELTEKQLAQVAILKAYIKRRSNMELLGSSGTLAAEELATAVAESLEYVRLYGISTASSSAGTHVHTAKTVIAAYENIETIIEESLDTLSGMVVALRSEEKKLTVRIMLTADNFSYESRSLRRDEADYAADVTISKEGQDIIIALTFTEKGAEE